MSSALALDEFSLEMRMHFIQTTQADLQRFKVDTLFSAEIKESLEGWISEARSNEMNFLVQRFEAFKQNQKIEIELTHEYLEELKSKPDSEELSLKYSTTNALSGSALYLYCTYGQDHFLIPVQYIVEIVSQKTVAPLPFPQSGVLGLMNFRGEGVPVVNLQDYGFHSAPSDSGMLSVVCEYESVIFAIEVNKTEEVCELNSKDFQEANEGLASPVVDHFIIQDAKTLMLLEIEKLVNK